jgi:hypothetical protein
MVKEIKYVFYGLLWLVLNGIGLLFMLITLVGGCTLAALDHAINMAESRKNQYK